MDQLILPAQTKYIPVNEVKDAFQVIRDMNVRGAPLIAVVALLGLCVDLEHKFNKEKDGDLVKYVGKCCDYLKESRPTAINLSNEILKLKEFTKQFDVNESVDKKKM